MIRSLASGLIETSIRKGRFAITPAKTAYKKYKQRAPQLTYNAWVIENEEICFVPDELKREPLISVVVPAYNPEYSHYLAMVYSVINQHYDNWELVIVNASDNDKIKQATARSEEIDTRIKVVTPDKNLGISGNTNFGLKHCSGEYVAFLDHDDLLHLCALHSLAHMIGKTGAGVIYSDEDKIKDDSSMFFQPFLKPRWSPDLFENVNYINHLTAIKKEHIDKVGGLRPKFDGAQDYDLLLRVIDICEPKVEHISRILYHWRTAKSSTANDFSTKAYVLDAGQAALQEHLKRRGIKGKAGAIAGMPGFYRTLPDAPGRLSVVVGPTDRDKQRLCAVWLEELGKRFPKDTKTELVIGAWFKTYDTKAGFDKIEYIEEDKPSYWQRASNVVSEKTVLCFAAAALPDDAAAIAELAAQASAGDVFVSPFIVGGKMILDAGLVESDHGKQRLFTGCALGDDSYYGYTGFVRNVAGLTLDIFVTSRENFARLTHDKHGASLSDIDLDRAKNADTRLIVNPRAKFNFKGALTVDKFHNDQYFNPQLTQAHTDLYVKVPFWGKLKELSEKEKEDV
jgi:hypothetical protein